MSLSAYKIMWVQVMFDLPVKDKEQRKAANSFRLALLDFGYEMVQFSIYQRSFGGYKKADISINKIEKLVPKQGKVSILKFTDKQFGEMKSFIGKEYEVKNPESQLLLF